MGYVFAFFCFPSFFIKFSYAIYTMLCFAVYVVVRTFDLVCKERNESLYVFVDKNEKKFFVLPEQMRMIRQQDILCDTI